MCVRLKEADPVNYLSVFNSAAVNILTCKYVNNIFKHKYVNS